MVAKKKAITKPADKKPVKNLFKPLFDRYSRARAFTSPDEFDAIVDDYFESTLFPVLSGMALRLGFYSRASFYDFPSTKAGKPYADSCLRARFMIETCYEMQLYGKSAGGAIFALKNMGWTDKQILTAELTIRKIERKIVRATNTNG